ncbi:hypothetical protein K502DRAFT_365820 [Neoconidiobolus thromboides FSU 785]|nr:hypothetical protein K502DRAFT_365820 [Neoconidiobolus thromboides FSU 785]
MKYTTLLFILSTLINNIYAININFHFGIRNNPISWIEIVIGICFIVFGILLLLFSFKLLRFIYGFSGSLLGVLLVWSIANACQSYSKWTKTSTYVIISFLILFSILFIILATKFIRVGASFLSFNLGLFISMIIFQYIKITSIIRVCSTIGIGLLFSIIQFIFYNRLPKLPIFTSSFLGSLFISSGLDCIARQKFSTYLNYLKDITYNSNNNEIIKPTFETSLLFILIPSIAIAGYYIQFKYINTQQEPLTMVPNPYITSNPQEEEDPLIQSNLSNRTELNQTQITQA